MIGYSLGGNIVLKHLAEAHSGPPPVCAITVSAPIDLAAASRRMMARRNAIYHRWLLNRMTQEAVAGAAALTEKERAAVNAAKSVYAFDDGFVAPRNGFDGADDYYEKCSAGPMLPRIEVPTLLLHGRNDPWIPAKTYDAVRKQKSSKIDFVVAESGGHVGFHGKGSRTPWHNECAYTFMQTHAVNLAAP